MKSETTYLEHIQKAISNIEKYLQGASYVSFSQNDMMIGAVIRELEIIGEAANNLNEKFRRENPEVPWRKMISIRNILIHEYFGVNKKIIWDTCVKDIPKLKKQIMPFLE
ncbi:MAG: DUF86 domain-containing protein [bacterium]|nr:DUF86 domain-containing protein [bacterium]